MTSKKYQEREWNREMKRMYLLAGFMVTIITAGMVGIFLGTNVTSQNKTPKAIYTKFDINNDGKNDIILQDRIRTNHLFLQKENERYELLTEVPIKMQQKMLEEIQREEYRIKIEQYERLIQKSLDTKLEETR